MRDTILTASGINVRRVRFPTPPADTYAIYTDDVTATGPDHMAARIFSHDVTVELYEAQPDDAAERAVEAAIDALGFPWTKQDRYWLQDVQRYQVIYELSYTVKT